MKRLIALAVAALLVAPQVAQAGMIVVAFDEVTGNPDNGNTQTANYTETGFAATYVTNTNLFGATTSGGLANATYGTFDASGTHTNLGDDHLSLNNGAEGGVVFTVTNSSGTDWNFENFHFDLGITRKNAADNWALSVVSGGLTSGLVESGGPVANNSSETAEWNDIDVSLSGLADFTLEDGASVNFLLDFTRNDTSDNISGHTAYADNFAITGTAVPEPTSLAMFGLGSIAMLRRHRRKR